MCKEAFSMSCVKCHHAKIYHKLHEDDKYWGSCLVLKCDCERFENDISTNEF